MATFFSFTKFTALTIIKIVITALQVDFLPAKLQAMVNIYSNRLIVESFSRYLNLVDHSFTA